MSLNGKRVHYLGANGILLLFGKMKVAMPRVITININTKSVSTYIVSNFDQITFLKIDSKN